MVTPDLEAQRVFNGFYSIGDDAYKLKKSKTIISWICLGIRGYVSMKQLHHSFTCDFVAFRKK